MNRDRLEQDLIHAEEHVAQGEANIERQMRIIGGLKDGGHSTVLAVELLESFQQTQALYVAERDRIRQQLRVLDSPAPLSSLSWEPFGSTTNSPPER